MLIKVIKVLITLFLLFVVAMILMFVVKGRDSRVGEPAGLQDGRLVACSEKPNCVSSEAGEDQSHSVQGFAVSGASDQAWQRAVAAVKATGGKVSQDTGSYLAATFSSSIFGFVDDVELRLDEPAQTIQVRSASREGYSDMGVNRKRVAAIRAALENN